MKKKIIIIAIVVILFILLVPIPNHLKDGGTVEYQALIYQISKVHRLNHNSKSGYDDGLIIKIFGMQVYNSVSKEIGETKQNETKTIDNAFFTMDIPSEWQYEEIPWEENSNYSYALKLYKSQNTKYTIFHFSNSPFGVCGTGRTTKEISLNNGEKATVGYYEHREWSDISFYEINPNVAFINYGLESDEAEEVLEFVKTLIIK